MWLSGDPRAGLEKLEEAIGLAERLGLPEPVLFLGYRGGIRCIMGDVGGLDDYERGLRLASERGRMDEASLLTFNHADALLSYRGPAAAAKALTEGLDAARRRRLEALEALPARDGTVSPGLLGEWDAETARRLTVNLIEALGMLGEWDEALSTAAELVPELERSEAGSDLVIVRTQEAVLRVCRGEASLAAPFLAWLEQRGLESEIPWISAYALLASAPVRFSLGQAEAALELLDGWESRPRPGSGPNYVAYLPEAVRTALAAGDVALAARLSSGIDSILPMQRNVRASLQGLLEERRGDDRGGGGPLRPRRHTLGRLPHALRGGARPARPRPLPGRARQDGGGGGAAGRRARDLRAAGGAAGARRDRCPAGRRDLEAAHALHGEVGGDHEAHHGDDRPAVLLQRCAAAGRAGARLSAAPRTTRATGATIGARQMTRKTASAVHDAAAPASASAMSLSATRYGDDRGEVAGGERDAGRRSRRPGPAGGASWPGRRPQPASSCAVSARRGRR